MTLSMFCKDCGDARDTTISAALCRACFKRRRKEYDREYRRSLWRILLRWCKSRVRRKEKQPEA